MGIIHFYDSVVVRSDASLHGSRISKDRYGRCTECTSQALPGGPFDGLGCHDSSSLKQLAFCNLLLKGLGVLVIRNRYAILVWMQACAQPIRRIVERYR